ncbi:hypothetical protein L7F22_027109 [Adiantum nelumboides]|nr:hypothetical protein [Adiantum nelumboides]
MVKVMDDVFEADKFVEDLDLAYQQGQQVIQKAQEKQKKVVDKHRRRLHFREGDRVLLRFEKARLRKQKGKEKFYQKRRMRYYGPFQISEVINDVSYRLSLPTSWKIHNAFHHQSDCTDVGLKAPDNEWKPLFMKDLSKLWRKEKLNLPWSEGDFGPSNTLLVDDTPYKAVLNPPNTAIFPRSYTAQDHGDSFLAGALRSYLEGIRDAVSVQTYVANNPFGEPSISPESPLWSHVSKVLLKVQSVLNNVSDEVAQVLPVGAVSDDTFARGRRKKWKRRKWHDGLLQLTHDKSRPFENFPSEAIELQSSEDVLPPQDTAGLSDEAHNSAVVEQAYKLRQSENESTVLSRHPKADEGRFKDDKRELKSFHIDFDKHYGDCTMQQKVGGAFEGGANMPIEKGLLCTAEEPFHSCEKADDNANGGAFEGGADMPIEKGLLCTAEEPFHSCGKANDNANGGAFEGGADMPNEKGLLCTAEEPFHSREKADDYANAGSNMNPEHLHGELGDDNHSYGNENGQKPCGDSGLNPSKSDWMQAGVNDKCHDERQELIVPRNGNTACISQNREGLHENLFHSVHSRNEQGRFEGRSIASHDKKRYHSRDGFDVGQNGKRQRGWYHNGSQRDCDYGHHSYGGGKCYQDRNKGSMGHGQNWNRGRERHYGSTTYMPDQTRHTKKSGHAIYEADKGCANRGIPFNWVANRSLQRRVDRRVENSAEYAQGNTRAPWNTVIDSNYSSQPYRSSRNFSHDQGGFPSSHHWHNGFEPRVADERTNAFPEGTQDWNVQDWHLDLTKNHPQKTRDWNLQGRHLNSAKRGGGRSSKPFRFVRAYQQSNCRDRGASRLPHTSNGASVQSDHKISGGWKNEWASRGFSKSRQS